MVVFHEELRWTRRGHKGDSQEGSVSSSGLVGRVLVYEYFMDS